MKAGLDKLETWCGEATEEVSVMTSSFASDVFIYFFVDICFRRLVFFFLVLVAVALLLLTFSKLQRKGLHTKFINVLVQIHHVLNISKNMYFPAEFLETELCLFQYSILKILRIFYSRSFGVKASENDK